ncbi:hypothetical protein D8674_024569 [Pyrus ussuriensis x Pyrus communis]|uniref:Uncharacterized protein n=1 Tax=Pyrus ussuriensis x Pyrus communis TaxID=2448454 RepID=A0A5N5H5N5_9ROSA|nr:hypothetical protein D8674_024569 [Pyrus ussuriensis x Pyrus communis]
MEKYFGNAYRGDPGVPHADPERLVYIWIGSTASQPSLGWHDKAMLFEQYHWKKWNEYMDKDQRESYYFNWPVYFPSLFYVLRILFSAKD